MQPTDKNTPQTTRGQVAENAAGTVRKTFADGTVLECAWKDGKAHGKGTKTYPCGAILECTWKDRAPSEEEGKEEKVFGESL